MTWWVSVVGHRNGDIAEDGLQLGLHMIFTRVRER